MTSDPVPSVSSSRGWIVSILFWIALLASAAIYGVVALAPKYLEHLELRSVHYAGQMRLVTLERQVRTLERVAQALEHDPGFVAELARSDLDAGVPGEERIPVAPENRLEGVASAPPAGDPVALLPWHAPIVRMFAENRSLRRALLIAAGVLAVTAFTFLHESREAELARAAGTARSAISSFLDRYRRRDEEAI